MNHFFKWVYLPLSKMLIYSRLSAAAIENNIFQNESQLSLTIQQQQYNIINVRSEFYKYHEKSQNENITTKGEIEMENTKELENMEINKDNLLDIMKNVDDTSANLNLMINYFSMLSLSIEKSQDEPLGEKAMTLYLTLINDKVLDNLQYVTENAVNSLKDTNSKLSYMVDKAKE